MRSLEGEFQGDRKAIVLVDECYARRALGALEANIDIISTRAYFRVLAEDFGLNDTASYWRSVLHAIDCGSAPKRDPADPQNKWLIYLRYIAFGRGPDRRRSGPLLKRIVMQKSTT